MLNSHSAHYLSGPCKGISLHRDGCHVWVYDHHSGFRYDYDLPDEFAARDKLYEIRNKLYAVAEMNKDG
ncbi:hypothetical protein [Rhizobium phage RHph_X2_24]|nr:hypothetical protein [Rhizobium phage RHph_X2_24]